MSKIQRKCNPSIRTADVQSSLFQSSDFTSPWQSRHHKMIANSLSKGCVMTCDIAIQATRLNQAIKEESPEPVEIALNSTKKKKKKTLDYSSAHNSTLLGVSNSQLDISLERLQTDLEDPQTSKKKEKKKKDRDGVQLQENGGIEEDLAGINVSTQAKKKKRHKNTLQVGESEEQPQKLSSNVEENKIWETDGPHVSEEVHLPSSKRKKKRKNLEFVSEDAKYHNGLLPGSASDPDVTVERLEVPVRKKKEKRVRNEDLSASVLLRSPSYIGETSLAAPDNLGHPQTSKKKKKKKLHTDNEQIQEEGDLERYPVTPDNPVQGNNKNKKHRDSEGIQEDGNLESSMAALDVAVQGKKKKKKHRDSEGIQEEGYMESSLVALDVPVQGKKKKKKHRDSEIIQEEGDLESSLVAPDVPVQGKKKKKKHRDSEIIQEEGDLVSSLVAPDVPVQGKKKKKKHKDSEGIQEEGDMESSLVPPDVSVQDKKKKMHRNSEIIQEKVDLDSILVAPDVPVQGKKKKKKHRDSEGIQDNGDVESSLVPPDVSVQDKKKKMHRNSEIIQEEVDLDSNLVARDVSLQGKKKKEKHRDSERIQEEGDVEENMMVPHIPVQGEKKKKRHRDSEGIQEEGDVEKDTAAPHAPVQGDKKKKRRRDSKQIQEEGDVEKDTAAPHAPVQGEKKKKKHRDSEGIQKEGDLESILVALDVPVQDKKKIKQHRDSEIIQEEGDMESNLAATDVSVQGKKKKKKHRDSEGIQEERDMEEVMVAPHAPVQGEKKKKKHRDSEGIQEERDLEEDMVDPRAPVQGGKKKKKRRDSKQIQGEACLELDPVTPNVPAFGQEEAYLELDPVTPDVPALDQEEAYLEAGPVTPDVPVLKKKKKKRHKNPVQMTESEDGAARTEEQVKAQPSENETRDLSGAHGSEGIPPASSKRKTKRKNQDLVLEDPAGDNCALSGVCANVLDTSMEGLVTPVRKKKRAGDGDLSASVLMSSPSYKGDTSLVESADLEDPLTSVKKKHKDSDRAQNESSLQEDQSLESENQTTHDKDSPEISELERECDVRVRRSARIRKMNVAQEEKSKSDVTEPCINGQRSPSTKRRSRKPRKSRRARDRLEADSDWENEIFSCDESETDELGGSSVADPSRGTEEDQQADGNNDSIDSLEETPGAAALYSSSNPQKEPVRLPRNYKLRRADLELLKEYFPNVIIGKRSTDKLMVAELARVKEYKQKGIYYLAGRFTPAENDQLYKNVEEFMKLTGISSGEKLFHTYKYPEEKRMIEKIKRNFNFLQRIGKGIPRSLEQIAGRGRKMFDINIKKGRYTEEEVKNLKKYCAQYGNKWTEIGKLMNRNDSTVQLKASQLRRGIVVKTLQVVREHNHVRIKKCIQVRDVLRGVWGKPELNRLLNAVKEVVLSSDTEKTTETNRDPNIIPKEKLYQGITWVQVAEKVETRNWTQCKSKWFEILTLRMNNGIDPFKGILGLEIKINMIKWLHEYGPEESGQIEWVKLANFIGNIPTVTLQMKMYDMKSAIPEWKKLSYKELLNHLYTVTMPAMEAKIAAMQASGKGDFLPVFEKRTEYTVDEIFHEYV